VSSLVKRKQNSLQIPLQSLFLADELEVKVEAKSEEENVKEDDEDVEDNEDEDYNDESDDSGDISYRGDKTLGNHL
jgi:hypothetical protein